MNLGRYRLLAQRGAGEDGISYRAEEPSAAAPVEVRVLSVARADAQRWQRLRRRLRTAALLDHPAAVRVLELELDHDPPFAAVEWVDDLSLVAALAGCLPLAPTEALNLGATLSATLAAAHWLGLTHARLGPRTIHRPDNETLKIDFTGIDACADSADELSQALDASCRAPSENFTDAANPADDVYALGAVLVWLLTGQLAPAMPTLQEGAASLPLPVLVPSGVPRGDLLQQLVQEMLSAEPAQRPRAAEVQKRLAAILGTPVLVGAAGTAGPRTDPGLTSYSDGARGSLVGQQLGRYRLLDKLGEGGMGAVWRAEDPADGGVVAIKVIRRELTENPGVLRRFEKEARLLAEVNNPFVTNLLEVNEDQGVPYLVLEYVAGTSVAHLLTERGRLDERTALSIMADVARALLDAHERGIIHRDIKPGNILLVTAIEAHGSQPVDLPRVKLSDFGLARHVEQSESLELTQDGAMLGTPLYMAPEQCLCNAPIGPRADVYAMGVTLFHILAGRPPFQGQNTLGIVAMHANEPPPSLRSINPSVSDGVCQVVAKCLEKSPESRYADAGALLLDLERLLRGEPTSIQIHPRLPESDPARRLEYDFRWDLDATAAQLWPHVSNTERLNRAIGLSAVQFSTEAAPLGGSRRTGKIRKLGMTMAWQEHPFEWIAPLRLGVLREFSQGPFKWLVSLVEMSPHAGSGTTLRHRIWLEPHGLLGRTAAAVEVGINTRRNLERVYRRIDAALTGKLDGGALADAFEEPEGLTNAQARRLDALLDRLSVHRVNPTVVERLGDFLGRAPAQEVARIRPLALARRLALDPEQVVTACLHGAREGLLLLLWDILCPACRIPSEVADALRRLPEHGRCEACNLDFELDFANSVEMIFRAHPEVRASELATYCIGGPAHSPHVVAQVRVAPGERVELDLAMAEGAYRLRGPQLPFVVDFRVEPNVSAGRLDVSLSRPPGPELPRALRPGTQVVALANTFDREVVMRVERTAPRDDALTAARAASLALFRQLFPGEVLSPEQLVRVATVTLLVTEVDGADRLYAELGDAGAFRVLREHFRVIEERVRQQGGAVVKTVGEGVVAAFDTSSSAVGVALDLPGLLAKDPTTDRLRLRLGIHRGPAMVANVNDHLDYFGTVVHQALQLPRLGRSGDLVLTQEVASDPAVAAQVRSTGLASEVLDASLPGQAQRILQRLAVYRG